MPKHKVATEGFFAKPRERFINREISWLEFNNRVLEEACSKNTPLLERVKFLSISADNLNEFFMVRVAGLKDQVKNNISKLSIDGLGASEQLEKVKIKANELMDNQDKCWVNLKSLLNHNGIYIESKDSISSRDKKHLDKYFLSNIFPTLSPIAVDPAHPFPFLPNLGIAVIMRVESGADCLYMAMLLPSKIEKFIRLPGKKERFIALEDVIEICKHHFSPDKEPDEFGVVHITRDSDLEIEDEAEDLVTHFENAVKKRRRGSVIALKIKRGMHAGLKAFVMHGLDVAEEDIIIVDEVMDYSNVSDLYECDKPKLKYAPYEERFPERINDFNGDCFAAIDNKDLVVHHPYETFDVVVRFLQQAARDPEVVAIKQTLYRTSSDSPIVKALIEAAEAGKSVTVVVELKARFDEESNIKWARNLERAGAQVVFGFVELKTHAKISLVVRKEGAALKSYVHFGTGNYHPITAKVYSDLSFFTCDEVLCSDASYLFNYLTGYSLPKNFQRISVSPDTIKTNLLSLINDEIDHAKAGRPANIWAKMNALIEPDIIDALYKASQAGVSIDLIVRGVCGLRPGIKDFSGNIRVKSIVGRFLEHSRIVCFGAGNELPSEKAKLFISSADWMSRNFKNRVEVMVPIENKTVHAQILDQIMMANIKDRKQSWQLNYDGSYSRGEVDEKSFSAHEYFIANPSLSGRGTAITEADNKRLKRKIYKLFLFEKE